MALPDIRTTSRSLALAAMIFAVAMTFIDQTIVAIAAPRIQTELGLSSTGLQWAINSYLLTLAAFFALGGRLADIIGARRMVTIGIAVFAIASALCGLTPTGAGAEGWLIASRALQGVGGALMYPAALAIVISSYAMNERGRALALFFGIAGGLTAVGPMVGGYLTLWTWRAIFWINLPVALIALLLLAMAKPVVKRTTGTVDVPGVVLVTLGVGLSVFGFQQSARWGWHNPLTGMCVALGVALLAAFVSLELRTPSPLIDVKIFRDRVFLIENVILAIAMMVFVPIFFFASEYAQIALGEDASTASLTLLYFFIGFVVAAQIGGRMLDRRGAKRPIVLGCTLACLGLALWADRVTTLSIGQQIWCIVLAGAGMGLLLGQANTDALNRAPSTAYGEATGITQTVRNYGAGLGLAILGTLSVTRFRSHVKDSLVAKGLDPSEAHSQAGQIANLSGGSSGHSLDTIPDFIRMDFANSTQTVLYAMAAVMGVAGVIALFRLPRHGSSPAKELARAPQQPLQA